MAADFETRPVESLMPPYTYYNGIRTFLQRYVDAGMPSDTTAVLDSYGSTAKHHMRSALRSLRWIDEHNRATSLLERFAHTSGRERMDLYRQILIDLYPYLLGPEAQAQGFDAFNASTEELIEKFTLAGVTARTTQERCVAFFRGAIRDAGWVQDLSQIGKSRSNAAPSLGGDAMQIAMEGMHMGNAMQNIVRVETSPAPKAGVPSGLPTLPNFDPTWSKEYQEMWLEMRYLELKSAAKSGK